MPPRRERRQQRRCDRRTATARRGFTLVEVMISLGVMTIGAMAVVAMQTHVIRLNEFIRSSAIAQDIAQNWADRFKQDAASWVQVGFFNTPGQPTADDVLQGTTYLRTVLDNPIDPPFQVIPPTANPTPSDVFDSTGVELPVGSTGHYCVGYRVQWVFYGRALRVDTRVIWPREDAASRDAYFQNIQGSCANQAMVEPGGTLENNVHTLYLSTVIRQTQLTR